MKKRFLFFFCKKLFNFAEQTINHNKAKNICYEIVTIFFIT